VCGLALKNKRVMTSKPCLYTAVQSVTLGGRGNCRIEFKTGANIRAISPKILLKPGVKFEKGATFYAKAGTVVNGLKSATVATPKAKVNYLTPSEYNGLIFDYSTGDSPVGVKHEVKSSGNFIKVFPNPVTDFITLSSSKPISGFVEITNLYGQIILKQMIENSQLIKIDLSALNNDMYLLKIYGNINYTTKIVKQ